MPEKRGYCLCFRQFDDFTLYFYIWLSYRFKSVFNSHKNSNFHFYPTGCNCHPNQTVPGTTCNVETGQCVCNFSLGGGKYGGRQCEGCALHTTGESLLEHI